MNLAIFISVYRLSVVEDECDSRPERLPESMSSSTPIIAFALR
jgi:hypothetical protein